MNVSLLSWRSHFEAARAGAADDVVASVSVKRLDETAVVRLDLRQLAFERKGYVDLGLSDVLWLARVLVQAAEELASESTSQR